MTHRDGFPRLSARGAGRGDAGHRKPCAPSKSIGPSASLDDPSSAAAALPLRRVDAPHRPRLPSYPPDRPRDLYGSLSTVLGIKVTAPWAATPGPDAAPRLTVRASGARRRCRACS